MRPFARKFVVSAANGRSTRKSARSARPRLEFLEDRRLPTVTVVGGLSNFDCTNQTGEVEDEFEIELPSVDPAEIVGFWANTPAYKGSGYGLPTVGYGPSSDGVVGHNSTYVDYKTSNISTPAGFTEHFGVHFANPTFMPTNTIYTWKHQGVAVNVPMPSVSLATTTNAAGGQTVRPVVVNNTNLPFIVHFHTAAITPSNPDGVQLGDLTDTNTEVEVTESEVESGDNGTTGVTLNPGEVLGIDGEAHDPSDSIIVNPQAWLQAHPGEAVDFAQDLNTPGESELTTLIVTDTNGNPMEQIFSAVNTLPPAVTTTSNVTTTAAGAAATEVPYGTPVVLTATVSNLSTTAAPTGSVQFYDTSYPTAKLVGTGHVSSTGTASLTLSNLPGNAAHGLLAVYLGTPNFYGSISPRAATFLVDPDHTATSLTTSTNATIYGQPVTFTATVSNTDTTIAPTGTVRFFNGTTLLGSVGIGANGIATFTSTTIAGGSYAVSASYVGSNNFNASVSTHTVPLTVSKAATAETLTGSSASAQYGQSVTYHLTVSNTSTSPIPSGSAAFYLDYGTAGQKLLGHASVIAGAASFSTQPIAAGTHSVTAIYAGNVNFLAAAPASANLTVIPAVTATALTSNASSTTVTYGTAVTFKATVTDPGTGLTPTGSVKFWDGTTLLGSARLASNGVATFTTANLSGGAHSVTATFLGSSNFAASATTSPVALTVAPAATAAVMTSSSASTEYGQPLTLNLVISNTSTSAVPTGTAAFYLDYGTAGQKLLGHGSVVGGTATFVTKSVPTGSHTVTGVYTGNANFLAAAPATVNQTVTKANTSTALTSNAPSTTVAFGTAVTFTATVTDPDTGLTPNGSIQFWDGTTLLATVALNSQGTAILTKSLARGNHSITAKFVGSANFNLSLSAAYNYTVS